MKLANTAPEDRNNEVSRLAIAMSNVWFVRAGAEGDGGVPPLALPLIILAGLLFATTNAHAQTPEFLARVFERTDANGDGKLDKDEVAKARARVLQRDFDKIDQDGNGSIERKELLSFRLPRRGPDGLGRGNGQIRPSDLVGAVVSVLERQNYAGHLVNDKISERLHEEFLRKLDPLKLYFLESDIKEFQTYQKEHDDLLKKSDVSAADAIHKRFKERFAQRMDWALELTEAEYDFDKEDTRPVVYEACRFASDKESAKERWRKEIKFELTRFIALGIEESQARDIVHGKYQRLKNIPDEDSITTRYLDALARSMDPHSYYLPPASGLQAGLSNSYVGIGFNTKLGVLGNEFTELLPGGAAAESGKLNVGDRLLSVGQGPEGEMVDVRFISGKELNALCRGEAGSTVRLKVENTKGETKIVELVRRRIEGKGVTSQLLKARPKGAEVRIGLIRIPAFYKSRASGLSTSIDTAKALDELMKKNVDAILIDLRGNWGGWQSEANKTTGLFLDGPMERTKNFRRRVITHYDDDDGVKYDGPLALLVSRYTASSSEILSMAIQDYRRGVLIGDSQTSGKGTGAEFRSIASLARRPRKENLGSLHITVEKFYGASGRSTLLQGLKPDIVLPSLFDDPTIGDGAMRYALTSDSVEPADFTPTNHVSEAMIHELGKRSESRRKASKEFEQIRDAKERWLAFRTRETMTFSTSLLKADESNHLKIMRDEMAGFRVPFKFGANAYEAEVMQIVADLVELSRQGKQEQE